MRNLFEFFLRTLPIRMLGVDLSMIGNSFVQCFIMHQASSMLDAIQTHAIKVETPFLINPFLLGKRANPNAATAEGETPPEIIRIIVETGGDLKAGCIRGKKAIDVAQKAKNIEMLERLEQKCYSRMKCTGLDCTLF